MEADLELAWHTESCVLALAVCEYNFGRLALFGLRLLFYSDCCFAPIPVYMIQFCRTSSWHKKLEWQSSAYLNIKKRY